MTKIFPLFLIALILISGCASEWKVQGGPKTCEKMCKDWDLEFTAMVGVGNQDRSGPGATACVCQPKNLNTSSIPGASSSSTSLVGPIVAAQAGAVAAAQQAEAASQSKNPAQR